MNEKDYLSIRCRLPASMEDMLPLLIGQWPVLGTHIIETAAGRISAAIFLDPNHGEAAGPLGELLGELGAEEVSVETVAAEVRARFPSDTCGGSIPTRKARQKRLGVGIAW